MSAQENVPQMKPLDPRPILKLASVSVTGPTSLELVWRSHRSPAHVDLDGWIESGEDSLAPLRDPDVFARAVVGEHGSSVTWDGDAIGIDTVHLEMLAEAQRPFEPDEAERWQRSARLSNQAVADVLGVSLTTWKRFKAGGPVPVTVVRLWRAAARDPLIVTAYAKRRAPGRPRTVRVPAPKLQ